LPDFLQELKIMKQALISLKTIVNPWKPPFNKKIEEEEIVAGEGQSFDSMAKVAGKIFKIIKCDSERCLVEFSDKFTLKGHEHPSNRQIWVGKEPVSFTYLWGEDGITKKLYVKRIIEA
jgi:hypothetical protein